MKIRKIKSEIEKCKKITATETEKLPISKPEPTLPKPPEQPEPILPKPPEPEKPKSPELILPKSPEKAGFEKYIPYLIIGAFLFFMFKNKI